MVRESTIKKYVGRRYGRLIVESFSRKDPKFKTHYFFNCKCDCGKTAELRISQLQHSQTQSCGCLGKERRLEANTGNTYRRGEYGESSKHSLFCSYVSGSRNRNIEFSLTEELFKEITSSNCFYCDKEPSQVSKGPHFYGEYKYNGIDRVDNSIGYHPDNCVACCLKCNSLKNGITKEMIFKLYHRLFMTTKEKAQPHLLAA